MTDGTQQPENKGGQPLQATATVPQTEAKAPDESVNWQALKDAVNAEANKVHSTLRKEASERDKYLKLARYEIDQHKDKVSKLQTEYDELVAKGEGGSDLVKLKKQLAEEQGTFKKERDAFAWEKAQLEEDAKLLHSTKLSDLIDDLCTAKESDPELRKQLIANVKELNPKTKEDVEKYVGLLNVKPVVKTPPASDLTGGGANLSDDQFMKGYSELKYNSPADHKRAKTIMDKRKRG